VHPRVGIDQCSQPPGLDRLGELNEILAAADDACLAS
jgi:hypothetical protein